MTEIPFKFVSATDDNNHNLWEKILRASSWSVRILNIHKKKTKKQTQEALTLVRV